ncbi:hypothetical protein GV828_01225 [Flavobacterium sp. NST-5]|uniref:Tetratricopeptide repeat protein n=1 Tax=Flavobacterium ichthyis TaxID=2698827 RepID=A0ABW9Z6S2_9FLAO|nr:tetratricopeptide repeat protein [Flavobacterium ichthyis]NBL63815.1 hypothetical protein [Flavobacterium ichthyis]
MNIAEFTNLLSQPTTIGDRQTFSMEKLVEEFPYFQSARAIYLKGLYNQDSFKYNQQLKLTAAHTTDRSVLFEFITSENFMAINKAFRDEKEARIREIMVNDLEIILPPKTEETHPESFVPKNTLEQSILTSIKEATPKVEEIVPENLTEDQSVTRDTFAVKNNPETETATAENPQKTAEEKLQIGKPLEFSRTETHSFHEWLQLASFKPIEREEKPEVAENSEEKTEADPEKLQQAALIDRFIETNPKIVPSKTIAVNPPVLERSSADNSYLMTETLAKVYLEQKKYSKAIQAYEILILKYPEKSHFFADRILDIKTLQQNNNS